MPWYCLRTKTRREHGVARSLNRLGHETYCPMARDEGEDGKKKKPGGPEPLFPRYLFFNFQGRDTDDFHPITKTDGVVKIVKFNEKFAVIPEKSIQWLKSREDADGLHSLPKTGPAVGDSVRVNFGPAYGLEGVVTARRTERIWIFLTASMREISLPYDHVEKSEKK